MHRSVDKNLCHVENRSDVNESCKNVITDYHVLYLPMQLGQNFYPYLHTFMSSLFIIFTCFFIIWLCCVPYYTRPLLSGALRRFHWYILISSLGCL